MIHIPKNVLNKLKFDKKIKFNKDTHKLEKERAEQNTKDFNRKSKGEY